MALLEEMCHWGVWALRFQLLKPGPVSLSLFCHLLVPGVELWVPAEALCLPDYHHDDNRLNF